MHAVIREDLGPGECPQPCLLWWTLGKQEEAAEGGKGESGTRSPTDDRLLLLIPLAVVRTRGVGGLPGNWMCGLGSAECQADHAVAGSGRGQQPWVEDVLGHTAGPAHCTHTQSNAFALCPHCTTTHDSPKCELKEQGLTPLTTTTHNQYCLCI